MPLHNPPTSEGEAKVAVCRRQEKEDDCRNYIRIGFTDLHRLPNVAHEQPSSASERLQMYSPAIKFEEPAREDNEGSFRRRVPVLEQTTISSPLGL